MSTNDRDPWANPVLRIAVLTGAAALLLVLWAVRGATPIISLALLTGFVIAEVIRSRLRRKRWHRYLAGRAGSEASDDRVDGEAGVHGEDRT